MPSSTKYSSHVSTSIKGHSLLEMLISLGILSILMLSLSLISCFYITNSLHSSGKQLKKEGLRILNRLVRELAQAEGECLYLTNSSTGKRSKRPPHFICLPKNKCLDFIPTKNIRDKSYVLFFYRKEYRFTKNLFHKEIQWKEVLYSERMLYIDKKNRLRLFVRTEKNNKQNKIIGNPKLEKGRGRFFPPIGKHIKSLEFKFFPRKASLHPSSIECPSSWDSTLFPNNALQQTTLPKGILLEMTLEGTENGKKKSIQLQKLLRYYK